MIRVSAVFDDIPLGGEDFLVAVKHLLHPRKSLRNAIVISFQLDLF